MAQRSLHVVWFLGGALTACTGVVGGGPFGADPVDRRDGGSTRDAGVSLTPDGGARAAPDASRDDGGGPDSSVPSVDAGPPRSRSITHVDNGSVARLELGPCDSIAPGTLTQRSYRYYWQDDFRSSDGLPDDHFTVAENNARINQEQQFYSPSQVTVDGEGLHLTARRVAPFVGPDGVTYSYRSGEVFTNANSTADGDAFQAYGRWEVCARLPAVQGSWPAIWLLQNAPGTAPGSGPWPPEIDIMEHVNGLSEIQTNVFWGSGASPMMAEGRHAGIPAGGVGALHVYAVEYDATSIDFFVDGTRIRSFTTSEHIPAVPMYLILNLAVGGVLPSWRSPCDRSGGGINMTCADGVGAYDGGVEMLVRYVRAYR
jgi:beta-glucanase (GH16 family)